MRMPIDEKNKLAFCHIPRTGGVSVSNALGLKVIDKHYPASWYRKTYPDYFLFTIERPYEDRIKSALGWTIPDRRKGFATFDELVNSILTLGYENYSLMLRPNEYFLDAPVDLTIRFKHLQRDLDAMMDKLGLSRVKLKPCNSFRQ